MMDKNEKLTLSYSTLFDMLDEAQHDGLLADGCCHYLNYDIDEEIKRNIEIGYIKMVEDYNNGDYISRQAAIEVLGDDCGNVACLRRRIPRCSYYDRMQSIPTADIQPVKRGRWFLRGGNWCCSACNRKTLLTLESNIGGCKEYGTVKTDYCPNCGAKMESEDK